MAKTARLEATITDRRGSLILTFFGQPRLITYWQSAGPGAQGIFAVTEFNRKLQLAHPDFVILDDGAVVGGAERNAALAQAAGAIDRALPADRQAAYLDSRGVRRARPGYPGRIGGPAAGLGRAEPRVVDLETRSGVHQPADRGRSTRPTGSGSTRHSGCS